MAEGVRSIVGNVSPEVGEKNFYEVASLYPGTVLKDENEIEWKLYAQQGSGKWRELRGPQKQGKKVPFTFPEKWLGKMNLSHNLMRRICFLRVLLISEGKTCLKVAF